MWVKGDEICRMYLQDTIINAIATDEKIKNHMFGTTIPEDSDINLAALFGNLPLFKQLTTYHRHISNLWLAPLPTNWSNETYLNAVRSGNLQLVKFMEQSYKPNPDVLTLEKTCMYAGLSGKKA